MKKSTKLLLGLILTLMIAVSLIACGDDSDDDTQPTPKFTVGGTLSGLSGTLVLQCNGGDDKTLTSDGAFTFSTGIADGSAYAVAVLSSPTLQDCSVSNGSGTVSGANVTNVSVSCTNKKAWTHPSGLADNISPDGQGTSWPQAAMDNSGNAIIVWRQQDGSTNCGGSACSQIFKSEYRDGSWTHPSGLADNISPDGQNASWARAAMDNSGNAIITWTQLDSTTDCGGYACWQVYKSEYRGGTWNHPAFITNNISPDGQSASWPEVVMDDNGNAIITWTQYDGSTDCGGYPCNQVYKSEYRGGTWTHPSGLADHISIDGQDAGFVGEVAMDNSGNAIIVWRQEDGSDCGGLTCRQVYKSEYRGGSWTHPSGLADHISIDGHSADEYVVAMDDNGNAIIAWDQSDGSTDCDGGVCSQIYKSEYRGGTWNHPAFITNSISPDGQDVQVASVTMDNSGSAIISWLQYDGTTDCDGYACNQVFKSEYRAGTWNHPAFITNSISPDGQDIWWLEQAMDNSGNAIITWEQYDGSTDCGGYACSQIYKSEFRAGTWNHPAFITNSISPDGQDASIGSVAMDDNGNAIILWNQDDGSNNQVFKSEYR